MTEINMISGAPACQAKGMISIGEPSQAKILDFLTAVRGEWAKMKDIKGVTAENVISAALTKITDSRTLISAQDKNGVVNAIRASLKWTPIMSLPARLEEMRLLVKGSGTVAEIKAKIGKKNGTLEEIMMEIMEKIDFKEETLKFHFLEKRMMIE